MTLFKRIFLCCLTAFAALCSYAQLKENTSYIIHHISSGAAVSTQGRFQNNAYLFLDPLDENSLSQKWQVVKAGTSANQFILVCDSYKSLALDVAPTAARPFFALLWTAGTEKVEQRLLIQPVSGQKETYELCWANDPSYKLGKIQTNELKFQTGLSSTESAFKFIETTPSPEPEREMWQDETVFQENKLPAHATFMPYAATSLLRADNERYAKPWVDPQGANYLSLNGTWAFKFVESPDLMPGEADFYGDRVDTEGWATIKVPSCVEMEGYGDPYYINVNYAFQDTPPYINMRYDTENTVSSYRRNFTLPEGWKEGKRIILHFDGAYSAMTVWVNGAYVGYSEGANTDTEFDITDVARTGENNVSVRMIRFSDASYLEGQDMWHMSGIHRDVYLYATPEASIFDHFVTTTLDDSYQSGNMNISLTLRNPAKTATTKHVTARLFSPEGAEVATRTIEVALAGGEEFVKKSIDFAGLTDLQTWTAETPALYTLELSQEDNERKEEMAFATKVGFREIKIENSLIYVNGERVLFKGANTQDTHPLTGRTVDTETLLRDVIMMKQANMNTIRGSHYPRQPKMYAMFDYYGLYCMDEADIECHYNWEAGGNAISRGASWKAAYVDRIDRMVLRDRNHPSVFSWSLGNESGTGANLQAAYDRAKELDPQRIVHYEGATRGNADYTDMWSVMYPSHDRVENEANNNWRAQPYFMCEYAHAMGNAVGCLKEYWEIIENSNYGVGGCVWDFVDQSIYDAEDIKNGTTEINGIPKYMTGSDYPGPHQGNFVNNGLVNAERAWSPELAQVKQIYQYVKFEDYDARNKELTVRNAYDFTDLSGFEASFEVLADGEIVEEGFFTLPTCAPNNRVKVRIPYTSALETGKEYFLNVTLRLKEATPWAEAGYPIAAHQIALQEREGKLAEIEIPATAPSLTIEKSTDGSGIITISNKNVSLSINEKDGCLSAWSYGEKKLIEQEDQAFDLSTYRWVENDRAGGESGDSYNGIYSRTISNAPAVQSDGSVTFSLTYTGSQANVTYDYKLYPSGVLDLTTNYYDVSYNLRRIGTFLSLPADFEKLTYYARGPWDNFVDRHDAAFFGRYASTVTDMLEPTPRPQTSGVRTEMRELCLYDEANSFGLKVESEGQVGFQALHFTDSEMVGVNHRWELVPSRVILQLDYAQKGLGNASCGGVQTLSKYYCPTGSFSNMVRFTPLTNIVDGIESIRNSEKAPLAVRAENGRIIASGSIASGMTMTVYDLGGTTVGRTVSATAATSLSVSMTGKPHGTYLVKINDITYKVTF